MASRGGIRSRPLTKTIFVKIGDGPETSPPDLVYSIKNALLRDSDYNKEPKMLVNWEGKGEIGTWKFCSKVDGYLHGYTLTPWGIN